MIRREQEQRATQYNIGKTWLLAKCLNAHQALGLGRGEDPSGRLLDGVKPHAWMYGKVGACMFRREQEQRATQYNIGKTWLLAKCLNAHQALGLGRGKDPSGRLLDGVTLHSWMYGKVGACMFRREQEQTATQYNIGKTWLLAKCLNAHQALGLGRGKDPSGRLLDGVMLHAWMLGACMFRGEQEQRAIQHIIEKTWMWAKCLNAYRAFVL
jgi:hypothetical protein